MFDNSDHAVQTPNLGIDENPCHLLLAPSMIKCNVMPSRKQLARILRCSVFSRSGAGFSGLEAGSCFFMCAPPQQLHV